MNSFLFIIVLIILLWIINRWNSRGLIRLANKVSSNKWHTFLAWGKIMRGKDILSCMHNHGKKYGTTSVFWAGPLSFFLSTDTQILKEVLNSKNCINKPMELYGGFVSLAGQGIITQSEPIWSQHRKLLNKAFSPKGLLSFLHIYNTEGNAMIHKIQNSLDKNENIDFLVLFRELTIKNGAKIVFKRDLDLTEYNSAIISKYMQGFLEYIAEITFNQIMTIKWIRKLAEHFIYKEDKAGFDLILRLVNESLDILQNHNTTDPSTLKNVYSVLDLILDGVRQNILKEDEIVGQIMHIFAGAVETTSSTLYFAVTLLAMHADVQERAYEEINSIITDNDNISMEEIDKLVYLEMIFNETMRILPVVSMVFRKVTNEDVVLSNGLTLPVGQYIGIDIYSLHRCKELWGNDADNFNPDNFLPENIASRDPYSYMPFTKGQRTCIGSKYAIMFSKIILAKLIGTYKFTTDFKYHDLKTENYMTLRFLKDPTINVKKRIN